MSPCTPPTETQIEEPDDQTEHRADAASPQATGDAEIERHTDDGAERAFNLDLADPYQDLGGGD